MTVRLQLLMQNYLMKHLEIVFKQREGNAETFKYQLENLPGKPHVQSKDKNVSKNLTFILARNRKERRRKAEQLRKTRREESLSDADGVTYEAGGF